MGFKKEKKVFKLVWPEGHEYHPKGEEGLEVRATSVPLGDFLQIAGMAKTVGDTADVGEISKLFQMFAFALVDWNLTEDKVVDGAVQKDVPVPATVEGLYSQELDFCLSIIHAWVGAISKVTEELGKESGSGEPSQEASIPMEVL